MRIPWHETKPQGKQNFASPGHSAKSTTQRERERERGETIILSAYLKHISDGL